jgi:hypothetical protein
MVPPKWVKKCVNSMTNVNHRTKLAGLGCDSQHEPNQKDATASFEAG